MDHIWTRGELSVPATGLIVIGGNSGDGMLQTPYINGIIYRYRQLFPGPMGSVALPTTTAEFKTLFHRYFPNRSDVSEMSTLYRTEANASEAVALLGADLSVLCPSRAMLRAASKLGRRAYGFYYSFPDAGPPGAVHGAELESVFGTYNASSSDQLAPYSSTLSAIMRGYWTSMAKGDPSGPGLPVWPLYGTRGAEMVLGRAVGEGEASSWRTQRCDYWDRYAMAHPATHLARFIAACTLLPFVGAKA